MATFDQYSASEASSSPVCGNFAILEAIKRALVARQLSPHQVLFVSDTRQGAAFTDLSANVLTGLHDRALPAATGAKLANSALTVIVESGEECILGGGNHFLAAIRRNPDITLIVHENHAYGFNRGAGTSGESFDRKTHPFGGLSERFDPIAVAIAMHAGFVGRGFSGMIDHLSHLICRGMEHRGLALVSVLLPCVSLNKVDTFDWYKERCCPLPESYNPRDWESAMKAACESEKIPLGLIYQTERDSLGNRFSALSRGTLVGQEVDREALAKIIESYT